MTSNHSQHWSKENSFVKSLKKMFQFTCFFIDGRILPSQLPMHHRHLAPNLVWLGHQKLVFDACWIFNCSSFNSELIFQFDLFRKSCCCTFYFVLVTRVAFKRFYPSNQLPVNPLLLIDDLESMPRLLKSNNRSNYNFEMQLQPREANSHEIWTSISRFKDFSCCVWR